VIVDGVTREALVHVPAAATRTPSPAIFAFHMRGGSMKSAAASFAYHKHWPEAIVVYSQGLQTADNPAEPAKTKAGWQSNPGEQNDCDLKLFDGAKQFGNGPGERKTYAQ
jgi:polyhydroxybutyrate depolymerase